MIVLGTFLNAEAPRYDRILPAIGIGVIGLTLFCGGIYHFFYEYVKPRRIKKIIQRPRLQYLRELGFEFDEENLVYFGTYKSFYLTIGADTDAQTGDSIVLNAFISPTEHQQDLLMDLQKSKYEIYFANGQCWLTARINFLFNTPRKEKFEKVLVKLIDDIRFRNITATILEEETTGSSR